MAQQIPQSNITLLGLQSTIFSQNLNFLQFWTELIDLSRVIKVQNALFNSLHASHCGENFGATGNPEDSIQIHRSSILANSLLSRSIGADLLSILVDGYKNKSCDAGIFVARDRVKGLLHSILSFLVDHLVGLKVFEASMVSIMIGSDSTKAATPVVLYFGDHC